MTFSENSIPRTIGVVLAGGLARRMGGGDKPLQMLGGKTLLERITGILRPQCAGLVINANGDPSRFAAYGLPVVADTVPDFAGPLAGLLAALDWTADHQPDADWVVSAGGDTPFLPTNLVARLHEACRRTGAHLAQAESNGCAHPVSALWNISLRDDLRRSLVDGQRKVAAFTAQHGVVTVDWRAQPIDPFFNVNTAEDLADAERLLAGLK